MSAKYSQTQVVAATPRHDDGTRMSGFQGSSQSKTSDKSSQAIGRSAHRQQDDVVIAVMGNTGTGKSSLIKLLTGSSAIAIGNSLDSHTSNIHIIRFLDHTSGRTITIVDTPGFDDSRENLTDTDILKKITKFLLSEYDKDRKLNGLVYLQRISDPRFGGQAKRNLKMFRNLCGAETYKNIVILTTFWDKVANEREGAQREEQLKNKYFKDLVDGGAHFVRHDRTVEGSHTVLKHILTLSPTNIQIQHEIRVEGKTLEDTAAGSVHREEVERIIAKHKEELNELKAEMEKLMVLNASFRRELEEERARARRNLERWEKEKSDLSNGLGEVRNEQARVEVDVAREQKDREKLSQDQERDWSSRLGSHARDHEVAIKDIQDQLDQEKRKRQESELRSLEDVEKKMREIEEEARVAKARMDKDRMVREEEMERIQGEQDSIMRETEEMLRRENERIEREDPEVDCPPPYETIDRDIGPLGPVNKAFRFAQSERYPPHLKVSELKNLLALPTIFNFTALLDTTVILFCEGERLPPTLLSMAPDSATTHTMQDLVNQNHVLHEESRQDRFKNQIPLFNQGMFFNKNIGLRDDWYCDAAFGQQQFTGTNPTTIKTAPRRWLDTFTSVAESQQRADIIELLAEDTSNIYIQDYSYFRSALNASPQVELSCDGRYACASVVLFHLEPEGKLHPLAITLDYRGSMEESVTMFNRRITSSTYGDESVDWPWRYAKMCAQVSDWLRHEVGIHLVNTHLVEEVIIVAAKRAFSPGHVVLRLLEPHWNSTLPLNGGARETLVPKIIIPMTGLKPDHVYAFIKSTFSRFDWRGLYVPNDLLSRGFPPEQLDEPKFHNYGYARNIYRMWEIIRKFVSTVLCDVYRSDLQVAGDLSLATFCQEVRSHTGGQLNSFPRIQTLEELIDFVTMSIHIASPQHTAVNYLQQYYQTFIPNKPSALYAPIPRSLDQLEALEEEDLLLALPVHKPRDWLLMAHVPYLLSFEVPDDGTILYYAAQTSERTSSTLPVINTAARILRDDLVNFIHTVAENSAELDDQQTPYLVMDPSKTAISILI